VVVTHQFYSLEPLEVELVFEYQRITARPPTLHVNTATILTLARHGSVA